MAQIKLGLVKLCLSNFHNLYFFQGRNSNYKFFILWSFLSKILHWPWSGPDGESQIRDKIHGLTGARHGCPGSDLVVIGDWLGRVFHHWRSPFLAIFHTFKKFLQFISLWSFGRNFLNYSVSYVKILTWPRSDLGLANSGLAITKILYFFHGRNSNYKFFILWSFLCKNFTMALVGARWGIPN